MTQKDQQFDPVETADLRKKPGQTFHFSDWRHFVGSWGQLRDGKWEFNYQHQGIRVKVDQKIKELWEQFIQKWFNDSANTVAPRAKYLDFYNSLPDSLKEQIQSI